MKRSRKQDSGDEKTTSQVKSARKAEVRGKNANTLETSQRLKRKQRCLDEDEEKTSEGTINSTEYRTAKRRREVTKQESDSSLSSSSDSEQSDGNSSDHTSWSSWGSDNGSSTELSEEKPAKGEKDYEKMKKDEAAVLGDLDHFWSSQVVPKARKEFGSLKKYLDQSFPSLETLKKRSSDVEQLMSLPCVVSVGYSKENSKFIVTVSDRNKALELSEELASPTVNLVEVRSSHLI